MRTFENKDWDIGWLSVDEQLGNNPPFPTKPNFTSYNIFQSHFIQMDNKIVKRQNYEFRRQLILMPIF